MGKRTRSGKIDCEEFGAGPVRVYTTAERLALQVSMLAADSGSTKIEGLVPTAPKPVPAASSGSKAHRQLPVNSAIRTTAKR